MISLLKLVNGTEVIGSIVGDDGYALVVDDPLTVCYLQKTAAAAPMIFLQRYSPLSASTSTFFKKEHIMNVMIPLKSMEKYYEQSLKNIALHVDPMWPYKKVKQIGNHIFYKK